MTTEEDLGVYGAIDCGAWVAHIMLAATSLGIATIAQAALAGMADLVRNWFAIPGNRKIVCAISFGYADPDHPANGFRTTRAARGGGDLGRRMTRERTDRERARQADA